MSRYTPTPSPALPQIKAFLRALVTPARHGRRAAR